MSKFELLKQKLEEIQRANANVEPSTEYDQGFINGVDSTIEDMLTLMEALDEEFEDA